MKKWVIICFILSACSDNSTRVEEFQKYFAEHNSSFEEIKNIALDKDFIYAHVILDKKEVKFYIGENYLTINNKNIKKNSSDPELRIAYLLKDEKVTHLIAGSRKLELVFSNSTVFNGCYILKYNSYSDTLSPPYSNSKKSFIDLKKGWIVEEVQCLN